jgi:plasmid stability protein
MPNISIKDVPETWAQALRQRAARNHRSLQGELMAIIEQAALAEQESPATPAGRPSGTVVGFDGRGLPIIRQGWKTIEQIAGEHRKRFPEPIQGGPLAVDIIREDRDSR